MRPAPAGDRTPPITAAHTAALLTLAAAVGAVLGAPPAPAWIRWAALTLTLTALVCTLATIPPRTRR